MRAPLATVNAQSPYVQWAGLSTLDAIGGPNAYAAVLEKIGAQPSPISIQLYGGLVELYGAVRLGKPVIDSLAALRSRMFALYYPTQCELLVGIRQPVAASWRFLASIDSTDLSTLFQLSARTTLAEINEVAPAPLFDRPRLVAAWRSFFSELPLSERDRFIRFLDAPVNTVDDECWFQRHLWALLPLLPEEDARVILWQIATNRFAAQR